MRSDAKLRRGFMQKFQCTPSSLALIVGANLLLPLTAVAQDAAGSDGVDGDSIVVTGFRQSLAEALDQKRDSTSFVDVIVAEDIAKFPDQNLAESLQRVPGVTIEREGGEGRRISVRGLGSDFTTVRLNGMQTIAAGADNGSRSFDFNIFASELFSNIVVHKSYEAALDEGSLGAVVDLNTGSPLRGPIGISGAVNIQGGWNSNTEQVKPRAAALISYKDPSGIWGINASIAYSKTLSQELGHDTVRWSQAAFDSVDGTSCWSQPNSGGTYINSTACDAAALAFHARIPRYVDDLRSRERLGATLGFEVEPTDSTRIMIDGLYSKFDEVQDFRTAEVLFRGNERSINVLNPVYQTEQSLLNVPNVTLVSATFNDAWVRTEHYLREMNTEFYQIGGRIEQDLSDNLRVNLLGGFSRSQSVAPRETTIMFDDRDAAGFFYDYSDQESPIITFGTDPTNPANFQLSELRDQISEVTNKFRTFSADVQWDMTDQFTASAGAFYRRYSFDTNRSNRNTQVCVGGVDVVLRTLSCTNTNIGANAVYGYPVTNALTELYTLPTGAGAPAGTSTEWIVADIDAAAAFTNLYSRPLVIDSGNVRGVIEAVKGGFLQLDGKFDIGNMPTSFNIGARYARTDQTSRGINSGTVVIVERSYEDWLPSANLSIEPMTDVLIRASYSEVLTRPNLGDLTPGGSVDGFNYRVTFGNPNLDPFRATSYDIGLEWYFRPQAAFSVAYFYKDVESFPIGDTSTGTFASTGLPLSIINPSSPAAVNPEGAPWTINSRINGVGATVKGWEVAFQTPLWFLPGFLDNFGVIANATFVSSGAESNVSGPGTSVASGTGRITPTSAVLNRQFFGLSRRSYNGTLYYEDDQLSARVSAAYRSPYLTGAGTNGNVLEGVKASMYVDASVSYDVTDFLTVSLEGINLTNENTFAFADQASGRVVKDVAFGRTISLGVRLGF